MGELIEQRFQDWLQARGYAARTVDIYMEELRKSRRSLDLRTCTPVQVEKYVYCRRSSENVRRQRWKALRLFFKFAVARRWRTSNPMRGLDPPRRPRSLSPQPAPYGAVTALLAHPVVEIRRAVALAALAGLRCNEICLLRWEDVCWDQRTVTVTNGKGGKARTVPMSEALAGFLAPAGRRGLVVPGRFGGPRPSNSLSTVISREARIVGFEVTLHQFRHLFATEVYRASLDVVATSRLLGHSSVDTTMIYVHVSGEAARDAVNQVGGLLHRHLHAA